MSDADFDERKGETHTYERRRAVSLSTPIQAGLILTISGFLVGAIWWAATMQAKIDQVLDEVKGVRALEARVILMEAKISGLEKKP